MHAEAMLLVHHRQPQIPEHDIFRKQRMGADQDVDLARRQPRQGFVAARAFFASRQAGQPHAGGAGIGFQRCQMLAHQQFGRRHQRRLQARFHRAQHGQQRHDGLARSHIALQQAQHALVAAHVLFDFRQRFQLRIGEGEGQGGDRLGLQLSGAGDRAALAAAQIGADQQQRQLIGQQFVIGQALARGRRRLQIGVMRGRMGLFQRRVEVVPAALLCRNAASCHSGMRGHAFPARRAPPWPWAAPSGLRSGHRSARAAARLRSSSGATT